MKVLKFEVKLYILSILNSLLVCVRKFSDNNCRKKKFGHWVLKSDGSAWFAAACVAILHTGIPFAIRAIAGL